MAKNPRCHLLMLGAGLRQGEAVALRWEDPGCGKGSDDPRRYIHGVRSLSRGIHSKEPRGRKTRKVPMSCRLWWALRALEREVEHEDSDVIVSKGEPASWRRREW